tara:strand:+ start:15601 stop:16728 length:1128 start_codon:yes stop_codon:yes gene_type:complete
MHLIERYSLSTGLQIDNPTISEQFFPIVCDKYICFHASSKDNLRDYDYWDEVKALLNPFVKKFKLKTVQIGVEKDPSLNCDIDLRGKTTMRQMAYVVKKSDLFIGVDSFPAHLAGFFNKKMVSIYSNSFAACVRPYWGDPKNQKIIETERPNGEKPSFSFSENPKTVNRIKPEQIANAALELFGESKLKHKTLFVGELCKEMCVEVIPTKHTKIVSERIDVRMDISHNEEVLRDILERNSVEVTTSKPISEELLASRRITKIVYKADELDEDFLSLIKKYGIKNALICTSEKNISSQRSKFIDCLINEIQDNQIIQQNKGRFSDRYLNRIKIKSGKKIICGDNVYDTLYDFRDRRNSDDFFLDLDWFMIYYDGNE